MAYPLLLGQDWPSLRELLDTLAQQKTPWPGTKAEGLLGEPLPGMSSGGPDCGMEANVNWQQDLKMGQFAVQQSWEDSFQWVYEGGIT